MDHDTVHLSGLYVLQADPNGTPWKRLPGETTKAFHAFTEEAVKGRLGSGRVWIQPNTIRPHGLQ
jgi:hypothetical protein